MADWEDIGAVPEGWEDISAPKKKTPLDIVREGMRPGVAESISSLRGLGETAAHLATGAIGGGLGTLFGTIAGLREQGLGEKGRPGVEKEAARQAEELTFAPRTEKGKEYAGKAGELISNVLIPLAPMAPLLEGVGAAAKTAKQLKAAGRPAAPPPGGYAPDVPLTLDEAIAQAEQHPANVGLGPRRPSVAGWEDIGPAEAPTSKRAKLQMELPLEEPAPIAVSPQGTAMVTPEQVTGYEQYGRRMETPEAPVQEPLRGQGDLFMNEEVTGPIASPINAAERGALPETITENPALARRQMELQLENQNPIYVSGGNPAQHRLALNQAYPTQLSNGTKITLERTAESPDRVVAAPGWEYNPDKVNQTIIARDENGKEIGRLDFHPGSQAIMSWVDPAYRRQGVGTMLYDSAEAHGAIFKGTGESLGTVSPDAVALRKARNERQPTSSTATAYLELPEKVRAITEDAEMLEFAQRNAEAKARELQAKQAVENGETGNLFADYVNQHRDYELFRDENGQPLSRSAFNETVDNLAKEKSTGYVRPENMDEAYSKYLSNFEGVQAGLFDQPTTALEMAQTLKNDATSRLVARHPLVKAAERFLNQEQQFLDQLKQQGANAAQIADAARDVAKAQAKLDKTLSNVEAGIKGGTKPAALKRKPTEVTSPSGDVTYMYEGIGETIRRFGSFSNILGAALDNKYSPEALRAKRVEITAGENKQKYLPQPVKKGLPEFTFERRPAAEIAADIVKNNVPDVGKSWLENLEAGGLHASIRTNNPIIRKTFAAVKEASHRANENIQFFIQDKKEGLPALFRSLNKKEVSDWWSNRILLEGDKTYSSEAMRKAGMSDKQMKLNDKLDQALDFAFSKYNEARAVAGKSPIDRRAGYLAGQASGDFKRAILNKKGDFIGVLAGDSRRALNRRMEKMKALQPDWTFGPEKTSTRGRKESRQKAFEDAVEMMGDKNPNAAALMDAYEQMLKDDAYNYMTAKKHAMQKKGVHGMEGFKIDVDSWTNAREGMASQIRYIEKILNWAEMSKAVKEVSPLLTDASIDMPNAKAWSSDYLDRALGIQTSKVGAALDGVIQAVGDVVGIGPSAIERGAQTAKGITSKMLLGFFNPLFLAMQAVQPLAVTPAFNSFAKSRGITGAHFGYFPEAANSFLKISTGRLGELTPFEQTLKKEGKFRNMFGSELFEHVPHLTKSKYLINKFAEFGIPQTEGVTRGFVFTHYANALKRDGLYKGKELFDVAENLTNAAMADYNHYEAPPVFAKMGMMGELGVTLQRYKYNSLSNIAMFAREASRNKSMRPLATALATGLAFSGLTGTAGYNEMDWAYQQITKALGKPDTLTRLAMDKLPDMANFGVISTLSGIDMSKRFGMALFPDSPSGVLFPGASKLADIGGAAFDAALSPTNTTQWERLAREATPGVLKGVVDRMFFEDEKGMSINPRTLEGQVQRTERDKLAKDFGGTGLHESKQKARLYQESLIDKKYATQRQKITDRLADDLYQMRGDPDAIAEYFTSGKGADLRDKFVEAEGNIDNLVNAVVKFQEKTNLTAKQRAQLATAAAAESGKEGDSLRAKRYADMLKKLGD